MPVLPAGDIMGYDRAITVFAPDGRLLQVEYARETVSKGATVIGITTKEGVVFIADKRILDTLIIPESIEKIFQIDDHIAATVSGLLSDGRVLVKYAQAEAQKHRITYDEPVDILMIVKEVCDHKQIFTQYGGIRPYGVSLLIGGVDSTGPRLFLTEPAGIFWEFKATSIGEGSAVINKFLEKNYDPKMSQTEAIKSGLEGLKKFLGTKFNKESVEIAEVTIKEKKFKKFDRAKVEEFFKSK